MEQHAPFAKLSPDQIAAIEDFEHSLAVRFGNPIVLVAFDTKK